VEAYLQGQGRFRHLFEPTRQDAVLARIQAEVDRYWAAESPSSRASKDGPPASSTS
jgi:hypothetical protein